jgi:hypothetical protein
VDGQEEHQRRASRLLICNLRFPLKAQKPPERSGGFFNLSTSGGPCHSI